MQTTSIRKLFMVLMVAISLLAACSPVPETQPTVTPTPEPTATATPTATPIPSPTPTPLPLDGQQTQYFIDATINYYNRFISIKSRSVYTNKTNRPIDEMVFIVYPTIFDAVYMRSVQTGDGTPVTDFRWESHRMVIPLTDPLMPGEQIEFVHDYKLYMPDREGVFGQTGRQLILSYWYPTIPPFDEEEGWLAYEISIVNSMFVGEYQSFESADFHVDLTFTDRHENMTIAAGALPIEDEDGRSSFFLPLARTFSMAISDSFTVVERANDHTLVRSFSFPEVLESSEIALDLADQSISLYSDLFTPYDREVISVVQVDMGINMEFDGIILIQSSFYWLYRDPPRSDLHIIIPHEIAHQWFFSLVGNNQAMEPWLDEALATYAEALFYEYIHPDQLDWWWDTRVHNHLPRGSIDTTIYLPGGVPEYFNRVYRRGALFIQELRNAMGDEAFFDFINDYINQHKYQIATGEDFWMILNQHTGADLTEIVERFFQVPPTMP